MATTHQNSTETTPARSLVEANVALVNTLVEAGYKAQTRSLNVARVFVEGLGRQQENARRIAERLTDPSLSWYSPERFSTFMNLMVENQSETLRVGREYIDEMNAAAAESRQTVETIVKQAGQAREAQQALAGQGFTALRRFAGTARNQAEAVSV